MSEGKSGRLIMSRELEGNPGGKCVPGFTDRDLLRLPTFGWDPKLKKPGCSPSPGRGLPLEGKI